MLTDPVTSEDVERILNTVDDVDCVCCSQSPIQDKMSAFFCVLHGDKHWACVSCTYSGAFDTWIKKVKGE